MSTTPVFKPGNLVEEHGAQVVGKAPWSPAAKEMEKNARERLTSPPPNPSGKGRRTRRRRGGKKSKYTRRR